MGPAPLTAALSPQAEEAGGSRQPRADRCPPPPRSLPPGACQAARCQADSECPRHRRCCYNGCAYACLEAVPPPPGRRPGPERGKGWTPRVTCPALPGGDRRGGTELGAHLGRPPAQWDPAASCASILLDALSASCVRGSHCPQSYSPGNTPPGKNDPSYEAGGDFSLKTHISGFS